MPGEPLVTTVVGSYPQPNWLVDHDALNQAGVPRIRELRMWRVPAEQLAEAQDDATILAIRDMERAGVKVDRSILKEMSSEFEDSAHRLETEIHDLAGEVFNVASPKQLGPILFEKLAIKKGGRTPTQAGMHLITPPTKPRRNPVLTVKMSEGRYSSWKAFLDNAYWSVELK